MSAVNRAGTVPPSAGFDRRGDGRGAAQDSYSANIKERRDYSCAVYDARGETVAMGDHMPVHLGAMPLSVRAVMERSTFAPGDVALVNDPFRGGTHLPDITAVAPVFLSGSKRPAFYLANRAHHADVGGMSPGSMPLAREIYQEGIRIPPVLIQRGGKIDRDLLRSDAGERPHAGGARRRSDGAARVAASRRAAAARTGREVWAKPRRVQHARAAGLQRAHDARRDPQAAARQCIASKIAWITTASRPTPVWIRVAVTIGDDRGTWISRVRSASRGSGECELCRDAGRRRCMCSAAWSRKRFPFTAGILRPIRVIAPEGTVVNAHAPAAMAAGNVETSQRITDVVLGALAKAVPDRIPAAVQRHHEQFEFRRRDASRRPAVRLLRNHRRRHGRVSARPMATARRTRT